MSGFDVDVGYEAVIFEYAIERRLVRRRRGVVWEGGRLEWHLKSVYQGLESIVYIPASLENVTIGLGPEHDDFQAGEQAGLSGDQRSELEPSDTPDQA